MRNAFLLIPLLAAAACDPTGDPADPTTGLDHVFTQSGWALPATSSEAFTVAADLDADGAPENALGMAYPLLQSGGVDVHALGADGALVLAHRLRADDLADDDAARFIFAGTALDGAIVDGRFTGVAEELTIALPFFPGAAPVVLPLRAVRLDVDLAGCDGRVAGAIPAAALAAAIVPALADQLAAYNAVHPGSTLAQITYDENGDGVVDRAEMESMIAVVLSPDIDLDADGEDDALSVAVGFSCSSNHLLAPTPDGTR
jgi:hypothetical protein